jgi:phosphoglycolate phosphatase-like HAD superfamily hydrolase
LQQAALDFDLELSQCVVIGDSATDYWAAQSVQSTSILVRTGRQGAQLNAMLNSAKNLTIVEDILEAVRLVKEMMQTDPATSALQQVSRPQ